MLEPELRPWLVLFQSQCFFKIDTGGEAVKGEVPEVGEGAPGQAWHQDLLLLPHPGEVSGRTLIDIGSGPTIYQLLSACTHFEDITMTDFLEANRQELGLWLQEEAGAFDWSVYSRHVCLIEGRG